MKHKISTYTKGLFALRDTVDLKEFEGKDYACMHSIFIQIEQNHLLTDNQKGIILVELLKFIEVNIENNKALSIQRPVTV